MSLLTKDTIEGLNRNPRTLLNGLEVAAKEKMLDYNDALKNNNEREAERLNAEINEIDERIVEVKAELGEESYEEMRKGNAKGGLTGNQTKLDMNKDGEISGEDFKLLTKAEGGLLIDDRQQYGIGGKILTLIGRQKKIQKELDTEKMSKSNRTKSEKELENLQKKIDDGILNEPSSAIQGEMSQTANQLKQRGFSPERIDELLEEAFELRNYSELETALSQPILKAEGGDIDGQMSMLMMPNDPEEDMLPDNQMEDEYLDFILDEALDSGEEDYLMDALQSNEQLSMIFDKVIDVAQEFAGSGPVEGPGSGVSDSIPARLSDGEFVFTAKAVDQIGADKLMAMMKDAEMEADDRQGLANGGEPEERVELPVEEQKEPQVRVVKETVDSSKGLEDEDEISKGIKSKMMLDPNQRHVRS